MTKKQQRLLGLFRELDQICREKKVEYALAGTTAAGAILAGGFLEGDETLNLYVTAKGWDILRQTSGADLPSERAFLGIDLDANDTSVVKRYAATDTCAVHQSDLTGNGKTGEAIRLIVLDSLPAGEEALDNYRKTLLLYAEAADSAVVYREGFELPAADYKKVLSACKSRGREKTLGELEETLAANKEETCPRLISRLPESPLVFEKKMIFPAVHRKFEGISAPVPGCISAYMTELYGLGWACRTSYGQEEAPEEISPEGIRPEEFQEEYLAGIRVNHLAREQKKHKLHALSQAPANHHGREKELLSEAAPVLEKLNEKICQGTSLSALMEAEDYPAFAELLKDYLRLQTSPQYIGRKYLSDWYFYDHPILLEVSEEIFQAGVNTLLYTGHAGAALRLLSIKKRSSTLPLAPALEKMRVDLLRFEALVRNYGDFYGKESGGRQEALPVGREEGTVGKENDGKENAGEETAAGVIDALLVSWPKIPEFLEFKARLLMEQARQTGRSGDMVLFLDSAMRLYPENGCFLKYRGELLWMRGRCADALGLFEKAREKTKNRLIWYEIETFLGKYSSQTVETCRRLISAGQKSAALQMAEQWSKLLPRDEEIRGMLYLARVSAARTVKEMEALVEEMTGQIEANGGQQPAVRIYAPALEKAWERLGFPKEAAEISVQILTTRDSAALELLAVKARDSLIHKDRQAEVYKVIGDAHRKQGQTTQAMEDYQKALDSPGKSYVKSQLSQILEEYRQAKAAAPAFQDAGEISAQAGKKKGLLFAEPNIEILDAAPGSEADSDTPEKESSHGTSHYQEDCWDYVRFCGKKLELEQYYLFHKEYIENLSKNQDTPALVEILQPYHQTTLRCLKKQEIFVPDEEIFHIYLETLEKTGNKSLKEKVERYW